MFALAVWIVISRVWLPRPEKKVITPTARRWILIGAVAFLAFQLFPNPLRATAGMGAHFRRLIDHSDLLTDTRVRVAFAGMPAFQEKFVLGHGIGSFSYVYPRFQGNYFLGHPNTPLDLTDKVTQRAHNDWLQLLIEMGVAGLAVVLWGLHLFWRRGWDFARSGRCPELQRPLLGGALVAGLVFMFQALFDFPMHVVPTAMTALLMAALVGNAPEVFGQQRFATPRSISRPGLIARWLLLGALAIWCLWPPKIWVVAKTPLSTSPATMAPSLPLLMSRVAGGVMADARHVRALADVDWYSRPGVRESPQGIQWLRSAARNLDEAVRLDPSSGFIQHTRGEVFTYLGAYDRQFYNRALESFDVATEEVRNFRTHYFLGECHYGLSRYAARDAAELEERGDAAGAQQARALEALQTQQAINWYEQALKLNPSDGHSADTQAKLLLRAGGTSAAVGTLRMMHRWAPQMYNERWVDATKPLINFGEHERALERLSVLRQVEPNNLVFPAMAAEVYVRRRDLDRARRTVEEGKQRWPEHRHLFEFIEAELNIVEGDLEAPVTLLRDVASRWESADVLLLEHLTLRMLGRADEANQPYAEAMTLLIAQGKDERTAAMTLGNFAWELFEDPETAEIYYRTTIENPPGPAILMNTRMAQRAMERGDRQRARALLEAVRQSSQGYALFQTLWAELNPEESPDGN
jgi:tetratricopeptide (TPR) repeat protein